jgi:hypothetical protein
MLHERAGVARSQYLRAFDRRNLVVGRRWSWTLAREEAMRLWQTGEFYGKTVLMLGNDVFSAFDYAACGSLKKQLVIPQVVGSGTIIRQIPHPSGRCRWYNDPVNREIVGLLLEELYWRGVGHA